MSCRGVTADLRGSAVSCMMIWRASSTVAGTLWNCTCALNLFSAPSSSRTFDCMLVARKRTIRGEHNLLVVLVEVVERLEERLLRPLLPRDELDIVNEEEVARSVPIM